MPQVVEGIEVAAVTRWLADRVPADLAEPLTFDRVEGGRSNLTYIVTDAAEQRWVLRRPPLHGVLESAHDMGREARIIAALADTAVPVPAVVGLETDTEVNGAPFYVMEHVAGTVLRDATAASAVEVDVRAAASRNLATTLAALHEVDPDEVGLGNLAKKQDYLGRQLRRWHRQYEAGKSRDLPLIEEVHARLSADIPPQRAVAIVHGDYRLDNVLVDPASGAINAVLDWELCTLGDPLADVGLLHVYWVQRDDPLQALPDAPTMVDGFLSREQVVAEYAAASGRDVDDLAYYVAFGRWKLAVILEGVYSRYLDGAYGDGAAEFFEPVGELVAGLAGLAANAADEAGR